ncbi:MAG: hypothetical protein CVV35_06545 [Methanomicrobiales archaeon HGW-Methanomicrobiales-6]|jgi:7-cyano-7-deazaguanine synthase|nr:MAG: hypothetical protein CVV35_06545 [Methanomicrobiales archaeon HGW-Methanomicrobiales-6]
MLKRCLLLFSGGIDSTACLYYYLSAGYAVTPLYVDFGQSALENELESISAISDWYHVSPQIVHYSCSIAHGAGEICGRNAFLIFAALMANQNFCGSLAMGLHAGTPYYDCSERFASDIQRLLDGYSNGQIVFEAPFLKWTKKMVLQYGLDNNVPIDMTYSCEKGGDEPCGVCSSCLDRRSLLC